MAKDKLIPTHSDQTIKLLIMGDSDISLDKIVKTALMFELINCKIFDDSCDINNVVNSMPMKYCTQERFYRETHVSHMFML